MRKPILITITTILSGFLFGFICSVVGTMGYVAAQGQPSATASPTATATPVALPTTNPLPKATPQSIIAPMPDSTEAGDPEAEYYRAIFDVCMYSARKADIPRERAVEGCRLFTRQTMKQKWFNEPSQEWEWPLPANRMPPGPTA